MSKNIAISYSLAKKKGKKCASGGTVESGDKTMNYAEGGDVSDQKGPISKEEADKFAKGLYGTETVAENESKKESYAEGGLVDSYQSSCSSDCNSPCEIHGNSSPGEEPQKDMVSRVMHARKMSRGGQVANDKGEGADPLPNNFDDLSLRDGLEFKYTGANSGDEIGGPSKDDLVSRAMLKRKAKR
jgi:hypothetical protein